MTEKASICVNGCIPLFRGAVERCPLCKGEVRVAPLVEADP